MRVTRTRRTPGGHDRYGDPITSTVTTTTLTAIAVAPHVSTEPDERGRHGVVDGWDLFLSPGGDLAHADEVIVNGETYTVDGDPQKWNSPHQSGHGGVVARLRRAIG